MTDVFGDEYPMQFHTEILLNPGDILYREGDTNDSGYIVESGEIILYSNLLGERVDCERRGAGSIVGELSILTGRPRSVTVEALTACRLYKVSAKQILSRFEKLDPLLRACIETSINFTGRFSEQLSGRPSQNTSHVPFAPSTLRNSNELIEQFKVETDILEGLERQEFSLVYQPIVQLSDGGVIGFEALMRWQHPTLGNVPPSRFVEIAEAMGSIDQLTNFALSEACSALNRMRAELGEDLFMSVNISGKDVIRYKRSQSKSIEARSHGNGTRHSTAKSRKTSYATSRPWLWHFNR